MAEEKRLDAFQDMKFGLFIHWGLYAVLAGEYRGTRQRGPVKEHIMRELKIPRVEYHKLAEHFNPVKYRPDQWVKIARDAGMKYIVITAKHHDGFAMFASGYDDYNIVDSTPYGKDILKALCEACREAGLKIGFYYSHARDWDDYHSRDPHGNTWDWPDSEDRNLDIYLDTKVKPQLRELLTLYGDVLLVWFDTPGWITKKQAGELYELVKEYQPDCLTTTRLGCGLGDYGVTGDNQIPPARMDGAWECPGTMNHTWGYCSYDEDWKSADTLLRTLVDLTSKGVNYLLNVGPKADGTFPQASVDRLVQIGEWMQVHGEAIYETQCSPWFQEFDWGRVTRKQSTLYLTLFDTSSETITLFNLRNRVKTLSLLTTGKALNFSTAYLERPGVQTLTIPISEELKSAWLPVIKVEVEGNLEVEKVD